MYIILANSDSFFALRCQNIRLGDGRVIVDNRFEFNTNCVIRITESETVDCIKIRPSGVGMFFSPAQVSIR